MQWNARQIFCSVCSAWEADRAVITNFQLNQPKLIHVGRSDRVFDVHMNPGNLHGESKVKIHIEYIKQVYSR
jgi:hypothetical protein